MTPLSRRARIAAPGAALALTAALLVTATNAHGSPADRHRHTEKVPTSIGYGGAVSSVDPDATATGSTSCGAAATRSTPRWPRPPPSA